ncbi:unnamed protein product, partial [Prorocentrum cordatum]
MLVDDGVAVGPGHDILEELMDVSWTWELPENPTAKTSGLPQGASPQALQAPRPPVEVGGRPGAVAAAARLVLRSHETEGPSLLVAPCGRRFRAAATVGEDARQFGFRVLSQSLSLDADNRVCKLLVRSESMAQATPWEVTGDLVCELGIPKVLAGSLISKARDCRRPKYGVGCQKEATRSQFAKHGDSPPRGVGAAGPPVLHVLSLGSRCLVARALSDLGFRRYAGPLDWVYSNTEMVRCCLKDGFAQFLETRNLVPSGSAWGHKAAGTPRGSK